MIANVCNTNFYLVMEHNILREYGYADISEVFMRKRGGRNMQSVLSKYPPMDIDTQDNERYDLLEKYDTRMRISQHVTYDISNLVSRTTYDMVELILRDMGKPQRRGKNGH